MTGVTITIQTFDTKDVPHGKQTTHLTEFTRDQAQRILEHAPALKHRLKETGLKVKNYGDAEPHDLQTIAKF